MYSCMPTNIYLKRRFLCFFLFQFQKGLLFQTLRHLLTFYSMLILLYVYQQMVGELHDVHMLTLHMFYYLLSIIMTILFSLTTNRKPQHCCWEKTIEFQVTFHHLFHLFFFLHEFFIVCQGGFPTFFKCTGVLESFLLVPMICVVKFAWLKIRR